MAFVFPFFMVAVDNVRSVILFKRGGRLDKEVHNCLCMTHLQVMCSWCGHTARSAGQRLLREQSMLLCMPRQSCPSACLL